MTTDKIANEVIQEREAEKERLRKENANLRAGIDRMSKILAGQSELDAKGDAAQNMRLRAENERLRDLLRAWWRNEIDMTYLVPRKVVEETIKIVAGEKE